MKKTLKWTKSALVLTTMAALFAFGAGIASAEDWGGHYRYYDRDGFYDSDHYYHHYEYYHHHRGYWRERHGVHVFINLG